MQLRAKSVKGGDQSLVTLSDLIQSLLPAHLSNNNNNNKTVQTENENVLSMHRARY